MNAVEASLDDNQTQIKPQNTFFNSNSMSVMENGRNSIDSGVESPSKIDHAEFDMSPSSHCKKRFNSGPITPKNQNKSNAPQPMVSA